MAQVNTLKLISKLSSRFIDDNNEAQPQQRHKGGRINGTDLISTARDKLRKRFVFQAFAILLDFDDNYEPPANAKALRSEESRKFQNTFASECAAYRMRMDDLNDEATVLQLLIEKFRSCEYAVDATNEKHCYKFTSHESVLSLLLALGNISGKSGESHKKMTAMHVQHITRPTIGRIGFELLKRKRESDNKRTQDDPLATEPAMWPQPLPTTFSTSSVLTTDTFEVGLDQFDPDRMTQTFNNRFLETPSSATKFWGPSSMMPRSEEKQPRAMSSTDLAFSLPELPEYPDDSKLNDALNTTETQDGLPLRRDKFSKRFDEFFLPNLVTTTPPKKSVKRNGKAKALHPQEHKIDWLKLSTEKVKVDEGDSIYFTERSSGSLTENRYFDDLYKRYFIYREPSDTIVVSENTLIKDAFYVLQGVPSHTFSFDEEHCRFVPYTRRMRSTSVQSLMALLEDIAVVGTHFRRLECFVNYYAKDSSRGGLVLQSFANGVSDYIQFVRSIIQNYESEHTAKNTLLEIWWNMHAVRTQLGFMATLCQCAFDAKRPTDERFCYWNPTSDRAAARTDRTANVEFFLVSDRVLTFPRGAQLLSYLYDCAIDLGDEPLTTPLLLSLLRRACSPYLKWVRDWIYQGSFEDVYGEFLVTKSDVHDSLGARVDEDGEAYWQNGFSINSERIPSLLNQKSVVDQLFRVGRSLNVLRLFASKFNDSNNGTSNETRVRYYYNLPSDAKGGIGMPLVICYSLDEIEQFRLRYTAFSELQQRYTASALKREMRTISAPASLHSSFTLDTSMEAKQNAITQQIRRALLEHEQEKQRIAEERRKQKQELYKAQLAAAEAKLAEKKKAKEEKLAEERSLIEFWESENIDQKKRSLKLEATKKIHQEYQAAIRQAEQRREIADWKFKRLLNADKRKAFLEAEWQHWDQELEAKRIGSHSTSNEGGQAEEEELGEYRSESDIDMMDIDEAHNNSGRNSNSSNNNNNESSLPHETSNVYYSGSDDEDDGDYIPAEEEDEDDENDAMDLSMNQTMETTSDARTAPMETDNLMNESTVQNQTAEQQEVFDDMQPTTTTTTLQEDLEEESDRISELQGEVFKEIEFTLFQERFDFPLQVAFYECIAKPIQRQYESVNATVMRLFLHHLRLEDHLQALRRYFLMQAGDLMNVFTSTLFKGLNDGKICRDEYTLNSALESAIKLTSYDADPFHERLHFKVNRIAADKFVDPQTIGALDHIELQYRVEWPLNIVISTSSIQKYNRLFQFLLRMKRVSDVVRDIWVHFADTSVKRGQSQEGKIRNLQLFRHEIQHFVTIMTGYIMTQVLDVTCKEFFDKLHEEVRDLEELRMIHNAFLDKAINRCLLSQNATALMNCINAIFAVILDFRKLVVANPLSLPLSEAAYDSFMKQRKLFRDYSQFLYKVLSSLDRKGYQQHLKDLVMRLNFNHHFG